MARFVLLQGSLLLALSLTGCGSDLTDQFNKEKAAAMAAAMAAAKSEPVSRTDAGPSDPVRIEKARLEMDPAKVDPFKRKVEAGDDGFKAPLAGVWKGKVRGEGKGIENGKAVNEPIEVDLELTFDEAGKLIYPTGRSGKVTITGPGQTFKYVNDDGHLTTETVVEFSITAAGGRFVTQVSSEFNRTYSGGSLAVFTKAVRSVTLTREGDGFRAVLTMEMTRRSSVRGDIQTDGAEIRAEGILKR